MAQTATNIHSAPSIFKSIAQFFAAIGNGLVAIGESDPRLQKAQTLMAMNDERLAEIGIRREDIVRHVFSGRYWA